MTAPERPSAFDRLVVELAAVVAGPMSDLRAQVAKLEGEVRALRTELQSPPERSRLVDAQVIADMIGTSRRFVYEHRAALGAVPLSDGKRPRLGFDPGRVRQALEQRNGREPAEPKPATSGAARPRVKVDLLPIKGKAR